MKLAKLKAEGPRAMKHKRAKACIEDLQQRSYYKRYNALVIV